MTLSLLFGSFFIALVVVATTLKIRRLIDSQGTGWWILLALVPLGDVRLIAGCLLLCFYLQGSIKDEDDLTKSPE